MSKLCHKVVQVSPVGAEKISFRNGSPAAILVRTEKRRNHNITLVQGLDTKVYGFDLEKMSTYLSKRLAASGGVEELPGSKVDIKRQIYLGGFWDRAVINILTEELGVPPEAIKNDAENKKGNMKQKKDQKSSNVIRG
eukprot:CAMPEP_0197849420 /NCGR_PEP_ID=MMETSP1438-20131217/12011_1 /TAXON_ID=1461541 /ORGANISM="Pterosperma sp., Strain CCMP1384" /LENGTH=137 /DNA_ID=CAMNT_0043462097 /DNA_START=32 /DNA_END=445 /DNA_ORIENTATION=-